MQRLLRPTDFQRVYREGEVVRNQLLVLHYQKNDEEVSRVGYSVSKKLGNAVIRNRVKRRLREAMRSLETEIEPGYDLILSARVRSGNVKYWEIVEAVVNVITRAGLRQGTITEGAGAGGGS